jgi:hypothetical protein
LDDAIVQELSLQENIYYCTYITNPYTNIAGVYKITQKRMSFDTGLDQEAIGQINAIRKVEDRLLSLGLYCYSCMANATKVQDT